MTDSTLSITAPYYPRINHPKVTRNPHARPPSKSTPRSTNNLTNHPLKHHSRPTLKLLPLRSLGLLLREITPALQQQFLRTSPPTRSAPSRRALLRHKPAYNTYHLHLYRSTTKTRLSPLSISLALRVPIGPACLSACLTQKPGRRSPAPGGRGGASQSRCIRLHLIAEGEV